MQTLPEATPRKEPTEIIGSLFAVVVVIPLKYPRANQCSRTIGGCAIQWTSPDYLLFTSVCLDRIYTRFTFFIFFRKGKEIIGTRIIIRIARGI